MSVVPLDETTRDRFGPSRPNVEMWIYEQGTTTEVPLYADSAQTIALTQPFVSDLEGRYTKDSAGHVFTVIWGEPGIYDKHVPSDSIRPTVPIVVPVAQSEIDAHADGIYVEDYLIFAVNDDGAIELARGAAAARATATGQCCRVIFGGRTYSIAVPHVFLDSGANRTLPVGQPGATKLLATAAGARIRIGPEVGTGPYNPGRAAEFGGFRFDGGGVAAQANGGVLVNVVDAKFDLEAVGMATGTALVIAGQNCKGGEVGASGPVGIAFDNGSGSNTIKKLYTNGCVEPVTFRETVTSPIGGYTVPTNNGIENWVGDDNGQIATCCVNHRAGIDNWIGDSNVFAKNALGLVKWEPPRAGEFSGPTAFNNRLHLLGENRLVGGGVGNGQFALWADFVSGGVAGSMGGTNTAVIITGSLVVAAVDGVVKAGTTAEFRVCAANFTRSPGTIPWWTTDGTGATTHPTGVTISQGLVGVNQFPGPANQMEVTGDLVGGQRDGVSGDYVRLSDQFLGVHDVPNISFGPGAGVGNTGEAGLAHSGDSLSFYAGKMLLLARASAPQPLDGLSALGDKLGLWGAALASRYGAGVQSNALVLFGPNGARVSMRQVAATGHGSVGTGALLKAEGADGTAATDFATKGQLDTALGLADAVVYKGAIDCSANPNYPAADAGHLYRVSVAGKIGGASGTNVEVGDTLLCHADGSASGTQAAVGANWDVIQANVDGAVVGPASAVSDRVATFNGTTGKIIKDSGTLLSALELAANKGAASGYMGLDAGSRGAQSPKLHHADHSKGGADAVALGDIATVIGDVPSALVDGLTDWLFSFAPWTGARVAVAGTWTPTVLSTVLGGSYLSSDAAQNSEIAYDLELSAGTWEITFWVQKGPTHGIYSVRIDGVEVGTFDAYNAASTANNAVTISSVVLAATGKKRLSFKMATKNASSSAYQAFIEGVIGLRRTA